MRRKLIGRYFDIKSTCWLYFNQKFENLQILFVFCNYKLNIWWFWTVGPVWFGVSWIKQRIWGSSVRLGDVIKGVYHNFPDFQNSNHHLKT